MTLRKVEWSTICKVHARYQHGCPHAQKSGAAKISRVIENKRKKQRPKLLARHPFPSPPPSVDRYYNMDARLAKETRLAGANSYL
jgi:hypothetical protein